MRAVGASTTALPSKMSSPAWLVTLQSKVTLWSARDLCTGTIVAVTRSPTAR